MASTSAAVVPTARMGVERRGSRGVGRGGGREACLARDGVGTADARASVATGHRRARHARAAASSGEDASPAATSDRPFRFCIDRGGTFTDVYAEVPGPTPGAPPSHRTLKLLSEDPANYESAPREGIRRVLEEVTGKKIPRDAPVPTDQIEWIRMGTTVATNALLERQGARTALVTTAGFKDLLAIGNQARPNIFDLKIEKPGALYETTVEVDERVRVLPKDVFGDEYLNDDPRVTTDTATGERALVETPLDLDALRPKLQKLKDEGVEALAVVLLHSYVYPDHEKQIGTLASELGFEQVSLSSQLVPMVRAVPRGHTACVDAYLTPKTREYLRVFLAGFDDGLRDVKVSFMQSDGGLTPADRFTGYKAILSGPAGGVVGYAVTTSEVYAAEDAETNGDDDGGSIQKNKIQKPPPCIGFDMGGTSTDVSRYHGVFEQVTETETAGVVIQAPQLDITTVAAGGGSRLAFKSGTFRVGPESVGSQPGPVCYRKGGAFLSVTDANVLLGRVQPGYFPKIFGPDENEPLDLEATRRAFERETELINAELAEISRFNGDAPPAPLTPEEIALGYLKVADEAMCRPIRQITESKGYETSAHVLAAFGGAGPQHACAVARALGIKKVFVHRFCGILSAYGMGLADVVVEAQRPFAGALCAGPFSSGREAETEEANELTLTRAADVAKTLAATLVADLQSQGFDQETEVETETLLNLRYDGTDTAMMISEPPDGDYVAAFKERFTREYGFDLVDRDLRIDDVRVRGIGAAELLRRAPMDGEGDAETKETPPEPDSVARVYFDDGWRDTPIFLIETLRPQCVVRGPAVIMNGTATVLVEPACVATLTRFGDLRVDVDVDVDVGGGGADADVSEDVSNPAPSDAGTSLSRRRVPETPDAVQLSIFSNRFMGIAEQMGRTLQRTSVSTNIKERLDFSCALFDPSGGLVANAPHVPVHLGAMSSTVRWQIDHWCGEGKEGLRPGDVLVTNHPQAGGSHLPDITVVTPVFRDGTIVFFVASRGHHADVGGQTPGSMPPFSRSIEDEGVAIKAFKLVNGGVYDEEGVIALLRGSRKLADNLSDLNAQAAANRRGIALLDELIDEHGLETVQAYMRFVQQNAELAVRDMLKETARGLLAETKESEASSESRDRVRLTAEDFMDDGSRVSLTLTLDAKNGSATFDFTGTSPEVYGNWNAPPAVTSAAVIYCVRCLVNQEIPLNEGCLAPIAFVIPTGSFLAPSERAAVVGGNVLTSQRVTDVCLAAFRACANSQGCMNNLTFGDETFGYYETIGGGAGAGPTWGGASGTQCHMTNTRITDPEILERRYPVVVLAFAIREGSGGAGKHRGGDGVRREIEFLKPITVSVLTERRVFAPRGVAGGKDGKTGENALLVLEKGAADDDDDDDGERTKRRVVNLGGKNSVSVAAGDILRILSPGGGGYGEPSD